MIGVERSVIMARSTSRWAALLAMLTLFASHVFAQSTATGLAPPYIPFARMILNGQIGDETQLGFKPPDLGIGLAVEKPIGRHVELQTFANYSPDKKYVTNNGNNFDWGATAIWFPRWRVGVSGEIRQSYLWTSLFDKSGWTRSAGIVVRDSFLGGPGRLAVDYVIPSGCVWATQCRLPADGIQSNRTQGPEFYQEFRVASLGGKSAMRMGDKVAIYHFCDQANPLIPTDRPCHTAVTIGFTVRIEFGGKDQWY